MSGPDPHPTPIPVLEGELMADAPQDPLATLLEELNDRLSRIEDSLDSIQEAVEELAAVLYGEGEA